jgi:hypothetical protein
LKIPGNLYLRRQSLDNVPPSLFRLPMKAFTFPAFVLILSTVGLFGQTASVTTSASTYSSVGGQVTFNVTLNYPSGAVPSLAVKPPGDTWAFVSAAGTNVPPVAPAAGDTTLSTDPVMAYLGFAYIDPPASPATFSFVLSYPAGLAGNQTIAFVADYRLNGSRTVLTVPSITLAAAQGGSSSAPTISTQPASQTVTAGSNVTFSVVANGTPAPTYQWNKGGSPISGATNSSYTITAAQSAAAGTYTVVVTNAAGSVTSNAATLTVNAVQPTFAFSQQPASIQRNRGETASFQAAATGGTGSVVYKWYKDGTAIQDLFGRISGSGTALLTISNVDVGDGGLYTVTATTVQNGSITSNGATLTVLAGPTITRPALDAAVRVNDSATFSVSATGSGTLSYQWFFTPNSGSPTTALTDVAAKIAGATTSSLTVSSVQSVNEGSYTCAVSDTLGVARSTAALSVVSRILKISAPTAVPGSDVVVSVFLQANGDENSANFAIVFDPSKLTYKSFAAGPQSDSGSANVPSGTTGRLNVLVGKTPPDVWTAGSNEIARITFTSGSGGGVSLVGFDDLSAVSPRSVSSAFGQTLPSGYQAAYVTSISGLEGDIDGDGKLTAADWTAMGRIVLGLDPAPSGEKFMRADCAPRLGTGGTLQLGDKVFNAADWTQVGRYVLGLDPTTTIGGPSGP